MLRILLAFSFSSSKILLAASIAGILWVGSALAVEIETGKQYTGGTSLTASEFGITTTVPVGWQAGLPAGASALIMERPDQGAYIMVVAERTTEAEILSEMSADIDMGEGITLIPITSPKREAGGIIAGTYRVVGSTRPGEAEIHTRLASSGVAVAYFAIDLDGDRGAREAAKRLAASVRFEAIQAGRDSAAAGEGAVAWQNYMRGRYIARFYSGSSYHEKTEIWLCSDGSFQQSGDAGGYGGAASGAWAGSGQGRWTATGVQPGGGELTLHFANGSSSYALSLEGGKLYLDGTQWLRGDNEPCP